MLGRHSYKTFTHIDLFIPHNNLWDRHRPYPLFTDDETYTEDKWLFQGLKASKQSWKPRCRQVMWLQIPGLNHFCLFIVCDVEWMNESHNCIAKMKTVRGLGEIRWRCGRYMNIHVEDQG